MATKPATALPDLSEQNTLACSGFCRSCDREHSLHAAAAYQACLQLMDKLAAEERIDFQVSAEQADPRCATSYLFGAARGKMFGVMVARTRQDNLVELRAFSGQYNGIWTIPGWVEPVFDLHEFHQVHDTEERKIKELSHRINATEKNDLQRPKMIRQRKRKSQQLMEDIHGLYRLKNFSGQTAGLKEIFPEKTGIPTGTGDCCAPKLLQYAAAHDLIPMSMAEFYWGLTNRSGSRQHGCFYPSCGAKCYPILGFMLCGLPGNSNNE